MGPGGLRSERCGRDDLRHFRSSRTFTEGQGGVQGVDRPVLHLDAVSQQEDHVGVLEVRTPRHRSSSESFRDLPACGRGRTELTVREPRVHVTTFVSLPDGRGLRRPGYVPRIPPLLCVVGTGTPWSGHWTRDPLKRVSPATLVEVSFRFGMGPLTVRRWD